VSPPKHWLAFNELGFANTTANCSYPSDDDCVSRDIGIMDQVGPLLPAGSQNLIVNINFVACLLITRIDGNVFHKELVSKYQSLGKLFVTPSLAMGLHVRISTDAVQKHWEANKGRREKLPTKQ
jgi:hypothetical protein